MKTQMIHIRVAGSNKQLELSITILGSKYNSSTNYKDSKNIAVLWKIHKKLRTILKNPIEHCPFCTASTSTVIFLCSFFLSLGQGHESSYK